MYVVAITGASGSIIGIRLIEELLKSGESVTGLVSPAGWQTIGYELYKKKDLIRQIPLAGILRERDSAVNLAAFREYDVTDYFAPVASGTGSFKGIIIAPTSMKTLAAVASGYADSLIVRAADVALKERRRCVLVPRETPVHEIHLENMLKLRRAGADIVLPVPGFYRYPQTIDDVVDFIVGKILSLLGIAGGSIPPWGE